MLQLEEAIQWMQAESACANFILVHGAKRVRVKCPGHPYIERDTFLEAVEDCKSDLVQRRNQGLYYYHSEYAQNLTKLLKDNDRKWVIEIFNEFDLTIESEEGSLDQRKFIMELAKTVPEIAEVLEEYELNLYDWRVAMIRIILLLVLSLTRLETMWAMDLPFSLKASEYMTKCPHCQSDKTIKKGRTKLDYQQYKCKDCGKYFSDNPQGIGRPLLGDRPLTSTERTRKQRNKVNNHPTPQ